LCEGLEIKRDNILLGLKNAKIRGRFQVIDSDPKIILDVAHNIQSIDILKKNLKKYFPGKKLHAVFSVLKDKDVDKILMQLKGIFETWHISESTNERALKVKELSKNKFFNLEKPYIYDNIITAFDGAIKNNKEVDEIIVVFGSSYTIAPILSRYDTK